MRNIIDISRMKLLQDLWESVCFKKRAVEGFLEEMWNREIFAIEACDLRDLDMTNSVAEAI